MVWTKGKPCYEETKIKISLALKGRPKHRGFGEKISRYWRESGRKKPWVREIGKRNKGRKRSEDFKRQCSERTEGKNNPFYGKHHTEETRKTLSVLRKGKHNSPTTEFTSERLKQLWQDPKYREQVLENCCRIKRPTRPEKRFMKICRKHNLPFEYSANRKIIGKRIPDFVNKEEKVAIEILGTYWHSPLLNPKLRFDRTLPKILEDYEKSGWNLVWFWDDEILSSNAEEIVLSRL